MKMKRTDTIVLTLLLVTLAFSSASAQSGDVAVVVNSTLPVDSISSAELRKIFSGEKLTWTGGNPVAPCVRAAPARERDVMLQLLLKMSDTQFQELWVKKVYSGQVPHEPIAVFTNGMQIDVVKLQKGAIALVSVQDLKPGVKVLRVDGLSPGSAGYPLK